MIRKDLKMRRGKEIAQGSHASMGFMKKLSAPNKIESAWIDGGMTKICVTVDSEEELLAIAQAAKEAMLHCYVVTDAGKTEFNGVPTRTCLAVGPDDADKIDKVTGHLRLY